MKGRIKQEKHQGQIEDEGECELDHPLTALCKFLQL
jgi:hypothetical protein